MIRRRFVESRWGQLHLRENGSAPGVPLVCLHATAYSSRSFTGLLDALDEHRHALAIDTPGYGDSNPPPARPTMADYADAIADALPEPVDLLGYHTGVSIAVEIALRRPERVRRLVLMGIPHFRALDFAAWQARLATPHRLGTTLDQFAERWDYLVGQRPSGVVLAQGFANFVDELKAWPHGSWAHEALFAHPLEERLPLVRQPVTVLNPPGHLAEPSRLAARLIRHAEVIELPALGAAPLLTDAPALAALLADCGEAAAPQPQRGWIASPSK